MVDSSEFPNPNQMELTERVVSPEEFLDLTIEYLNSDYKKEVEAINSTIQQNPIFEKIQPDSLHQVIVQAGKQMGLDLPNIIQATQDAMAGKSVKLIKRDAGSFFYTGELLDQHERPAETYIERRFRSDERPDIVNTLAITLENRPRQDLSAISGFAGHLGIPNLEPTALRLGNTVKDIESQARKVVAKEPIQVATQQGQNRLAARAA